MSVLQVLRDGFIPGDWVELAVCAQTDPELFFPEKGGSPRDAQRVCASCPVSAECLLAALAHPDTVGVWGGTTTGARRQIRQLLGAMKEAVRDDDA